MPNLFNSLISKRKSTGRVKLEELFDTHWGSAYKGEQNNDHGERTNRKLNDQPFYHRSPGGKMKKW